MRASDTTTVDVNGRPIRVRIGGPEAPLGAPVVMIHGIARALEDFTPTHDVLAESRRVVSVDLPGFGFSRAQPGVPGLPTFADAVAGVIRALDLGPSHVLGNSLGGGVTMTLAVRHRELVASAGLLNSVGFGREVRISAAPMLFATLAGLPVVGQRFGTLARAAAHQGNRDLFWNPQFATDAMLRHYGKVARQPDFQPTFLRTAVSLGVPGYGVAPGWRRELLRAFAATEVPTVVVWGSHDRVLPPSHLDEARRALPHARIELMDRTGHLPQYERPQELAALLAPFHADADPVHR